MSIRSLQPLTVTPTELRNAVTFPNVMAKVIDHLAAHTQALRVLEDRLTLLNAHVANDLEIPMKRQLQEIQQILPQLASLESVNTFAEEMRNELFEASTSANERLNKHDRMLPMLKDLEHNLEEEKEYVHNTIYVHLKECEDKVSKHGTLLNDFGSGKDSLDRIMSRHSTELKKVYDQQKLIEDRQFNEFVEVRMQLKDITNKVENVEEESKVRDDNLEMKIRDSEKRLTADIATLFEESEKRPTKLDVSGQIMTLQRQMDDWKYEFQELENQLILESKEMKDDVERKTKGIQGEILATQAALQKTIEEDRETTTRMHERIEQELDSVDIKMKDLREKVDEDMKTESLKRRKQVSGVEVAMKMKMKKQPEKILKRARVQVIEMTREVLEEHRQDLDKALKNKLDAAVIEPLLASKADNFRLDTLPTKAEMRQLVIGTLQDYTAKAQRGLSKAFSSNTFERGLVLKELESIGLEMEEDAKKAAMQERMEQEEIMVLQRQQSLQQLQSLHKVVVSGGGSGGQHSKDGEGSNNNKMIGMEDIAEDENENAVAGNRKQQTQPIQPSIQPSIQPQTPIQQQQQQQQQQMLLDEDPSNGAPTTLAAKVDKWAARLLLVNHDVLRIGSLVAELHNAVATLREEKEGKNQCMLTRSGNQVKCQNCHTYISTGESPRAKYSDSLLEQWPFPNDTTTSLPQIPVSSSQSSLPLPPSASLQQQRASTAANPNSSSSINNNNNNNPNFNDPPALRTEMQRRKLVSSESKRGVLSNRFGGKIPNDNNKTKPAPSPRNASTILSTCPDYANNNNNNNNNFNGPSNGSGIVPHPPPWSGGGSSVGNEIMSLGISQMPLSTPRNVMYSNPQQQQQQMQQQQQGMDYTMDSNGNSLFPPPSITTAVVNRTPKMWFTA